MNKLREGVIVHYREKNGQHNPAIVQRISDQNDSTVSLHVFRGKLGIDFVTGVCFSTTNEPNTWGWIPE